MLALCECINVPIKSSKIEGSSTSISFLEIHLDTITTEASITPECKEALLAELNQLYWYCRCLKRELLSLIGKLSFTCKVVPPGRTLRRLIDFSTSAENLHHHLPLTQEAKCDMKWWLDFLPQWPGKSLIPESHWTSMHQWNCLLLLLAMMAGEHTGQNDGSQIIGQQHRAKSAFLGRSYMPLLLH